MTVALAMPPPLAHLPVVPLVPTMRGAIRPLPERRLCQLPLLPLDVLRPHPYEFALYYDV